MSILVAGVGNVLRGDDGFGVAVARRLAEDISVEGMVDQEGMTVVETGIAGIALLQELQRGWDGLVVVDAMDRGRAPGTVLVVEPIVLDVDLLSRGERSDVLADVHLATPERVLALARALGVLPTWVRMVGCQPVDAEVVRDGLSAIVEGAVDVAVAEVLRLVAARQAQVSEG